MTNDSYRRTAIGHARTVEERLDDLESRLARGEIGTRLGSVGKQVTDWNTAIDAGFYWSDQNASNKPSGTSWLSGFVLRNNMDSFERVVQEVVQPSTVAYVGIITWRRIGFPDGVGGWSWGTWYLVGEIRGSTTQRDAFFGVPATDATRVALANRQIRWFNVTTGRTETYYVPTGTSGLTAPGIYSGLPAGWYTEPAQDWATLGGPLVHAGGPGGPYATTWAKGVRGPGALLNPFNTEGGSTLGITVGQTGQYQCWARMRMASANTYITLAINGNRDTLEQRADGMFNHDHAYGASQYSLSEYIGRLDAGEVITAGPPAGQGGTVQLGSSSILGTLMIRRIS